ncbi:MAG TPA: glucose-6-phosphate dehydrogenase assembly protein OpcA [Gaiellaceae bacterium]
MGPALTVPAPAVFDWSGTAVSVAQIDAELARLRGDSAGEDGQPHQRTSVMTHIAWVPPEWLDAAERVLAGMAERHPSRTVILVPRPEAEDGIDAELAVRCFPIGESTVCGEVIELSLGGNRSRAPASMVLPLLISDLPVFLRWRGEPPFGEPSWEQLVDVADRVVVDSSEWSELRYAELAQAFARTALSDIAWARTGQWRVQLADRWPTIRDQEIEIRGPRSEATLLRGWLQSRLDRALPPVQPAGEFGVRLDGEEVPSPRDQPLSPSDLLSAELDHFGHDRIYEAAALASV